jgi:hypothetical protein
LGIDQQQLRRFKMQADRFALLQRCNNLTWGHHYEVSSLKLIEDDKKGKLSISNEPDKEKMQWFLEKAVKNVTKAYTAEKRRADREGRLQNRQLEELRKARNRRRMSARDAAFAVMEEGSPYRLLRKGSSGGKGEIQREPYNYHAQGTA